MSQEQLILNHLKSGRSLTPLKALELYGCFRLGARIHELKTKGYKIITSFVKNNGKKFASYKLGFKRDLFE